MCSQRLSTGSYPEPAESILHITSYFLNVHFHAANSPAHVRRDITNGLLPSGIPINLYQFLVSPCPNHLILSDLITLIRSGEGNKLWGFSLSKRLHSPVTWCLSEANIFLQHFVNRYSQQILFFHWAVETRASHSSQSV